MPFINRLEVEQVKPGIGEGNALWKLTTELLYRSAEQDITITVPAGFVTDFASVPRLPIAFLLTADLGNAAATVHDYLYSKRLDGTHLLPRDQADAILREALEDEGVSPWRAESMYWGVRLFGQKFYNAERSDDGSGARVDSEHSEGARDDV